MDVWSELTTRTPTCAQSKHTSLTLLAGCSISSTDVDDEVVLAAEVLSTVERALLASFEWYWK
jgi:hypothetical protein